MHPKATTFLFTSYVFEPDKKRILFNYKTEFFDREPVLFSETVLLPSTPNLEGISDKLVKKLLESLHIMLGISYYKFYCATKLHLPYTLSKKEAHFWNTVYKKGLGEFFYQNNLDPKILPKFPRQKNNKAHFWSLPKSETCLVGIGGGKDSIVVAELLKEYGYNFSTFFVQTDKKSPLVENIFKIIGVKNLKIQRRLDWQTRQEHQYNGHIPISAIYAFLGLAAAIFYRHTYVVVGNEYSSNFGNTTYKGMKINHQWSKSFEFETLFREYVKNSISPDVLYFSLLRSFYEIRIVKIFSNYKKYFPYFSSCNGNFKFSRNQKTLWCGQCPKCVFVFTLLSAYLGKKDLLKIFGKNLYQDKNLLPMFKNILGFGKMKPFDCVGTFAEAQTALHLAKKHFGGDFIVRQIEKRAAPHKEVFLTNKESCVPEQYKLLGMERALIAGYGKEGKVTLEYLKKYCPDIQTKIADATQGEHYLDKQTDLDIAIKTPGIKKELIKIPYTTATNIFFSRMLGRHKIIGVTGSKGKSTTASLIYHILTAAKKNVMLLGNIGTPMLGALIEPLKKDTIFVLELSSYQLDDIAFSPDIAVVTNLFPEHMDFHGDLKHYYQAKKNIINFQCPGQYFVHNEKTAKWLKEYQGTPVVFSKNIFESNLIGKHNESNIGAAVSVANILHVPEETIKKAVLSFKGLPHRLELVGTFKGITFYDDAISTTPESTIMAIQALKNVDTILLGGQDRGYDFLALEKVVKRYKIKNIVLFPDSGNKIIKDKKGLNILHTESMKEAVAFAFARAKKGSVCLLSCASPSYSLWKNFEEKGNQFTHMARKYETTH